MADLNFDDLIPSGTPASPAPPAASGSLSFDDLIPTKAVAATPTAAPKPSSVPQGIWDKIKAAPGQVLSNLNKEVSSMGPTQMAEKVGQGLVRGVSDVAVGAGQLITKGASGVANMIDDKSNVAKYLKDYSNRYEGAANALEKQYQDATPGSVLAGVGRGLGSIIMPAARLANVDRAASVLSKMGSGAVTGATTAATMPVYGEAGQASDSYWTEKAKQQAFNVGPMAAIPLLSKGILETTSKLGVTAAKDSLVKTRMAQLFDKSPAAAEDARVIRDMASIKEDPLNFNQLTGKPSVTKAGDARGNSADYKQQVREQLKEAGISEGKLNYLLNKKNPTSEEVASVRGTPQGDAVADAISLSKRSDALTKEIPSNSIMSLVREGVDLLPIPAFAHRGIKNMLGGRQTREAAITKLTSTRNVEAADRYAAENGGAALDSSLGALSETTVANQTATATKTADRSVAMAAEKADAATLSSSNATEGVRAGGGSLGATTDRLSKDTGISHTQTKGLLQEIIDNPASDPAHVRVATAILDNKPHKGMLPLQDRLVKMAEDKGIATGSLSEPKGALSTSGTTDVKDSVKYAHGVAKRTELYDQGIRDISDSDLPKEVISSALSTIKNIRTQGGSANRAASIQELYAKHPDYKINLNAVFKDFK